MKSKHSSKWKIYTAAVAIFTLVITMFLGYAVLALDIVTRNEEITASMAGASGDTFGILTSLFTGMAFAGLIVTMLMQGQELRLQRQELSENREEFKKSANAQERNAKLVALSTMLTEYSAKIRQLEDQYGHSLKSSANPLFGGRPDYEEEYERYKRWKKHVLMEIERILNESGIDLANV